MFWVEWTLSYENSIKVSVYLSCGLCKKIFSWGLYLLKFDIWWLLNKICAKIYHNCPILSFFIIHTIFLMNYNHFDVYSLLLWFFWQYRENRSLGNAPLFNHAPSGIPRSTNIFRNYFVMFFCVHFKVFKIYHTTFLWNFNFFRTNDLEFFIDQKFSCMSSSGLVSGFFVE